LKIPKKFKIIGRDVAVVRDHAGLLREGCYGMFEWEESVIKLRESKPYFHEYQEAQTFLHEIIHGVDFSFDINLQEDQVRRLAVGLIAVIRDNQLDFRKPDGG
jgi:hypothetical protein